MPLSGEGALVHIKQDQGKGKSARDLETAEVDQMDPEMGKKSGAKKLKQKKTRGDTPHWQ